MSQKLRIIVSGVSCTGKSPMAKALHEFLKRNDIVSEINEPPHEEICKDDMSQCINIIQEMQANKGLEVIIDVVQLNRESMSREKAAID